MALSPITVMAVVVGLNWVSWWVVVPVWALIMLLLQLAWAAQRHDWYRPYSELGPQET